MDTDGSTQQTSDPRKYTPGIYTSLPVSTIISLQEELAAIVAPNWNSHRIISIQLTKEWLHLMDTMKKILSDQLVCKSCGEPPRSLRSSPYDHIMPKEIADMRDRVEEDLKLQNYDSDGEELEVYDPANLGNHRIPRGFYLKEHPTPWLEGMAVRLREVEDAYWDAVLSKHCPLGVRGGRQV
jgi:hypothetical protein